MPIFGADQLADLERWLQQGLTGGVRRGVVSAAFRTLGEIQNVIIPDLIPKPVDQGAYRAAWQVEVTPEGADIVNSMPYAGVIERGARPENIKIGRAMIDALVEWIIRKGLVGKPGKSESAKASTLNQARGIAFAIANSMKKRGIFNRDGTKGLRVGEKAIAFFRTVVQQEVDRELRRF